MNMKKLLFFIIGLMGAMHLFADGIQFAATAPQTVEVGEQFYIRYTLNQKATPKLPEFKGFKLVGGPSVSTSSSTQIYNNTVTQTMSYSYSYVLQATAEGTYTISPAKATYNGQEYSCNSLTIKVVAAGSKPRQQQNNRQQQQYGGWGADPFFNQQPATPQEVSADDIFIRTELDKTSVYQGEKITATVKIYTKLDLLGFEDFRMPGYDGFWSQEVDVPNQIQFQTVQLNGARYNVGVLKKTILYPQRSGTLNIGSVGADVVVRQRVSSGGRSMIDDFFGYYQNKQMTLNSPVVRVQVKPLPQNAPGYFKGAVGNFSISSKMSHDSIKVNDAMVLSLTISGSGNLKLIDPPQIQFPKEFEVYDPQIQMNLSKDDGESKGSKTFEYTIIPRYPGTFTIGEIKFAYFDPGSGAYKTLKAGPLPLVVYKMPGDTTGQFSSDYSRKEVDYIGDEDIRFIYTGSFEPVRNRGYLLESIWFWLIACFPLFVFILALVLLRKKIRENSNQAYVKTKKANKTSLNRLKKAGDFLNQNRREDFFREVMTALWGYLGDKLSIPVSTLSKDNVSQELSQRNVDDETISRFLAILEECEFAHFAPSEGNEQTHKIYADALEMINLFEQKLKS